VTGASRRSWCDAVLRKPLAKKKVEERLAALESRVEEFRRQERDAAGEVERHYREMLDLQRRIADAKIAARRDFGERALRRKAEALRSVIQPIECSFTATAATGSGPGKTTPDFRR
jgi:predicted RNase H-like nuclease (RuvC/YqgF family)